jgi:hypothetical protein
MAEVETENMARRSDHPNVARFRKPYRPAIASLRVRLILHHIPQASCLCGIDLSGEPVPHIAPLSPYWDGSLRVHVLFPSLGFGLV